MALPELDGVPITEYLGWYNEMTVMMNQDKEPIVDPPVEDAKAVMIVPLIPFEPHENQSMSLVSRIYY